MVETTEAGQGMGEKFLENSILRIYTYRGNKKRLARVKILPGKGRKEIISPRVI